MQLSWQTIPQDPPPRECPWWKLYSGEACPHGLHIVLVDGTHVRNKYDSDFSQGGNGFAYDFVPEDEIWIDAAIPEVEWPLIGFHECRESELMRRGLSYSMAHDQAKLREDKIRRSLFGGQT